MLSSRIYRCVLIYYYVCHAHVYSVKNLLKCLFTLLFASQWQLIASVTRSRGGADGFFFVSVFSNPYNYNFSLQQISLKLILTKSHQTNHINLRSLWFEVWNVMHAKPVNIFYLPFWKKAKGIGIDLVKFRHRRGGCVCVRLHLFNMHESAFNSIYFKSPMKWWNIWLQRFPL